MENDEYNDDEYDDGDDEYDEEYIDEEEYDDDEEDNDDLFDLPVSTAESHSNAFQVNNKVEFWYKNSLYKGILIKK